MATSCFSIPLSSSSRTSSIANPKYKTLIESLKSQFPSSLSRSIPKNKTLIESPKAQFPSSSSLSRSFLAQTLQIKVYSSSSSFLSVLDEEEKQKEEEEEIKKMKKPRPCELYICNLPRSYDIPQLLEMFQPFGIVISVEVSKNPETGESRGSGYLTMGSINSAKNAIASLDGTEVGGRELRVRYSVHMNPGEAGRNKEVLNSTPKSSFTYESPYKVFVGNLPQDTQPDALRQHFSGFGTIVSAKVVHDYKTGKRRVFGFLSYANNEEREAALSLHGTEYKGRTIVVGKGKETY